MCRLMAACPGMKRNDVLDLIQDMLGTNTDGFGFGYLGDKGEFVIQKTNLSLEESLKKKSSKNFISWPEDRWVIFHIRRASVGAVCYRNAHPFLINNQFIGCHNGSFKEHSLIKAALPKSEYNSDTDSEVALKFLAKIGHPKFNKICGDNGVYLTINLKGELCAIKNTFQGDLKIVNLKDSKSNFLISEMPVMSDLKDEELDAGYYIFDKQGKLIKSKIKKSELSGYQTPSKPIFRKASEVLREVPNHNALPHIYQHQQGFQKPVKIDGKSLVTGLGHYEMNGHHWD